LAKARGQNEEKIKSSFVGASGVELLRMLDESRVLELTAEDRTYISKYYNSATQTMLDMSGG